ncbi:Putative S-adenosyl-L-methionine-dependent methyltransferase [uncultured archaeon]|nr:Putative S-adenosyl-L-methionine-dependent methyltransferase [uncultured archaeon]
MSLSELIIQKIRQQGPISFRDFMELALYYPGLGYYTSDKFKIGKKGDYYTSPNLTPAFGEMLGKQIEEMWRIMGEKEFTIVEMGAGTGLLSMDVIEYLKRNPGIFSSVDYCIVEKSPALQKKQQERLGGNARWCGSIHELSGMTGCVFSNELVDAFPVHQVVMEKQLMEVFVDFKDGFVEILNPASDEIKDYFTGLGVVLPEGYRTEANLDAVKWIQELGSIIKKGFVITIDYGYPSSEIYQEYRNRGTLMCYHNHVAGEDPYRHIGEQDITSHVNFSALSHWGKMNGLEPCGFTDQAHFLMSLGIDEYLKNEREKDPVNYWKKMLPVKTLLMEMGETFKILVQKKRVECNNGLSCLMLQSRWKI